MAAPGMETVAPGLLRCSISAGGQGGGAFDDLLDLDLDSAVKLARVEICPHNGIIDSMSTTYSVPGANMGHFAVRRGGIGPNASRRVGVDVTLGAAEVIVQVSGEQASSWGMLLVSWLEFQVLDTSCGRRRMVPEEGERPYYSRGRSFEITAPEGHCIAGFFGRDGWYLDNIGVYFRRYVRWEEETHRVFPAEFKARARALLLAWRLAPEDAPLGRLPWEAVRCIIGQMSEESPDVPEPWRRARPRELVLWGPGEEGVPELLSVAPGLLRCPALAGGQGGGPFDDLLQIQRQRQRQRHRQQQGEGQQQAQPTGVDLVNGVKLSRVEICPLNGTIGSMSTTYNVRGANRGHVTFRRGGTGPETSDRVGVDVTLGTDEVIVQVSGEQASSWGMMLVTWLEFQVLDTSSGQKRMVPELGERQYYRRGHRFEITAPEGHCIAGFFGHHGWYLDNVGVYFRQYVDANNTLGAELH